MDKAALIVAALALVASAAVAEEVSVYTVPDDVQDDWVLDGTVEELGNQPNFPTEEWIGSDEVSWGDHIPCPSEYQAQLPNRQVLITNRTGRDFPHVYYVADPQTGLTNWDEMVGQRPYLITGKAFKIDNLGENTPLVYESIAYDNVFQAGETWEFVIQEYSNATVPPVGPAAFGSVGIANGSGIGPAVTLSSGSIITPEPTTMSLLLVAGLLAVRRRRR